MMERTCKVCGATFSPVRKTQSYCSRKCEKKANYQRRCLTRTVHDAREFARAWKQSRTVPVVELQKARRKPENTSAVRWRIELRRRASAEYYANCGGIYA